MSACRHNEHMGKDMKFPITGGGIHVCYPRNVVSPGFEEFVTVRFERAGLTYGLDEGVSEV